MKTYKVKHYRSRIYNPIRGKIIRGVLIAIIVASLFLIGWFSYEPLMAAINEKNKEIIEQEPIPEKPPEPVYEPEVVEFLEKETVAVIVPEELLYNALDYHSFLSSLGEHVTAVVIDMKTQSGTVTYLSEQVSVVNAGAAHENAANLPSRIKTAKDMGFDVVTRIYAFEDSTAPFNAGDMAIRYESEDGILWLDDSVDNGGKPWLNPYSDTAQKYILDIVYDAIDFGADAILLEGMRFPENEGMEYAYFGVGIEDVSHEEILSGFARRIYSAAVLTDTNIIIGFDSYEFITGSDIYGGNPVNFSGDGYSPFIDIDDFVGEKINDDFNFRRMPDNIAEVFMKIYESLGNISGLDILPVLDFEGFTQEQTRSIFEYLKTKGATGYILLYNEAYFTGIPEEPVIEEQPQTPVQPVAPTQPSAPSSGSSSSEAEEENEEEEEEELPPYADGGEEVADGIIIK